MQTMLNEEQRKQQKISNYIILRSFTNPYEIEI